MERILKVLNIGKEEEPSIKKTLSIKQLLHKDCQGQERKHSWNNQQVIGMMTYLQGTSRYYISMDVHQAARFAVDQKLSHYREVLRFGRYLKNAI